ncbi:CoA-transferase family III domain-containing protein [Armillaria novae-zelandiae]|uniref:CoA-transferase family III domain-containing protein n=1 Tax=Armillaria novae-zelandiae TaxID=153914 RepID=A0AA39PWQ3_9AGAR|nr:CoA-transferase family III domain-containing protein [Armillaria novae-zelandiae]
MDPASSLWLSTGLPETSLRNLHLDEPAKPTLSSFNLGDAAQATIGLSALSAAYFHQLRTGVEQDVSVDSRHAALEFHSETHYTLDGVKTGSVWDSIAGLYKTRNGGYVRIHTNFPHHRKGILDILDIPDTPTVTRFQVQHSLVQWDSIEFETEAARRGMCVTAYRSFDEWNSHPQAEALRGLPPVTLTKIGEAPKRRLTGGERPLDGIRVLDLSRVIAGPVAGRALAAHGADVLLVTSPHLPALPVLDADTSRGKRTTQLDLNTQEGVAKLRELCEEADVFLQAYRPGALEAKGFGVGVGRPGMVYASLNAWGWDGPWKDRRGFDSLVQTATGFNADEGAALGEPGPRPLPMQALDHVAGYLLAFGINAALCKTLTEGGSWEVRVSLAAVGQWIRSLGRVPVPVEQIDEHVEQLLVDWEGERKMRAIRHAAIMSETPVKVGNAPARLDMHLPEWLPI